MLILIILFILYILVSSLVILYLRTKGKIYDGRIVVGSKEDGGKLYSLELAGDPGDLEHRDTVNFKVVRLEN